MIVDGIEVLPADPPRKPRKRLTQEQAEGLVALAAFGGLLLLGQALYDAACDRVAEQNKRRMR